MAAPTIQAFKYVPYQWDESIATSLHGDEVSLLLYRSNLLGADLRLTNYGGGNTSCKIIQPDPLTGEPVEVMWIKGSGGDLGTLKKNGLAALYVNRLTALKKIYKGIDKEDEMVELFNHCIFDLNSKAPSIDTPLHAFLPFKHIDHLHPDAAIAIAASKDGKKITEELFKGQIGWVNWKRPGFDLGLELRKTLDANPSMHGIMLGNHGLFTWGNTSFECYINTLETIEKCAAYIEKSIVVKGKVFGGNRVTSLPKEERIRYAAQLTPALRGLCSSHTKMIGHFTDDERVLEFMNSNSFSQLAPLGTSCPDHFLRTKISPLIIELPSSLHAGDPVAVREQLFPAFSEYR
ncbi:MAG TPA: class II aldolase/adducin family protein, partial [Flavitalea sp.]|nr:class II aldolase/adducin family protein [Flavitalea sp.]